jgi:hypothetical protein
MEVAKTILNQLGGIGKLKAMVSANNFVADANSLKFAFKGCKKANIIKIELNPLDFYSVEFYKLNRKTFECPMVEECEIVYFDQLKRAIETVTGLFLSI